MLSKNRSLFTFKAITPLFALLLSVVFVNSTISGSAQAQPQQHALDEQLSAFSLHQLHGRWREIARGKNKEVVSDGAHIFFVPPKNEISNDLEFHTPNRIYKDAVVSGGNGSQLAVEFRYNPKAEEMNFKIPADVRKSIEGQLEWRVRIIVVGRDYSPVIRVELWPGEVEWTYDDLSGNLVNTEIIGSGEPIYRYYAEDPIIEVNQQLSQRIEVNIAARNNNRVTLEPVESIVQGRKLYPRAYLDERLAEEKGRRITLTMKGEVSGAEATIQMESTGKAVNGTMEYGVSLSRSQSPLGRAITLATCGANYQSFYPPIMSVRWLEDYFEPNSKKPKGTCLDFSGASGEIVEFSIDGDAIYRVRWYPSWYQERLERYRRSIAKLELSYTQVLNNRKAADSARVAARRGLRLISNYKNLINLSKLTDIDRIALSELYAGSDGNYDTSFIGGIGSYYFSTGSTAQGESFPSGGLFFQTEEALDKIDWRNIQQVGLRKFDHDRDRRQGAVAFRLRPLHAENNIGKEKREAARAALPSDTGGRQLFRLEQQLVDKALLFSSAVYYDRVMRAYYIDGFKGAYGGFVGSLGLGPFGSPDQIYTLLTREDIFGNQLSSTDYWLNVGVATLEFGMGVGGLINHISDLTDASYLATGGKIRKGGGTIFADALGNRNIGTYKARMKSPSIPQAKRLAVIASEASGSVRAVNSINDVPTVSGADITSTQKQALVLRSEPVEFSIERNDGFIGTDSEVNVRFSTQEASGASRNPANTSKPNLILDAQLDFGENVILRDADHRAFSELPAPDGGTALDQISANYITWKTTGNTIDVNENLGLTWRALEQIAEAQPEFAGGLVFARREANLPRGAFNLRLHMAGIEGSSIPKANGLNLRTLDTFVRGNWAVEVEIPHQRLDATSRRIVIDKIDFRNGVADRVSFFDPYYRRIVELPAEKFFELTGGKSKNSVRIYRADNPRNPIGNRVAKAYIGVDDLPSPFSPLVTDTPKPGYLYKFKVEGKDYVFSLGERLGAGSFNEVYRLANDPDKLVRISQKRKHGNPILGHNNDVFADKFGREILFDPDINSEIVTGVDRHASYLSKNADGTFSHVEIVNRFEGEVAHIVLGRNEKAKMTNGQAIAYVAALRELNRNGYVWLDGHNGNYSFIKRPGVDKWKIQIFDAGGVAGVKGNTAARRAQNATALQNFSMAISEKHTKNFDAYTKYAKGLASNDFDAEIFAQKYREFIDNTKVPGFVDDGVLLGHSHWTAFRQNKVRELMLDVSPDVVRRLYFADE